MLMGAGLGAGTAMLTGNDPLKGAAMGGASWRLGGNAAMSSARAAGRLVASGQQCANAPDHLAQTGAQQAAVTVLANGQMGMVSGVGVWHLMLWTDLQI